MIGQELVGWVGAATALVVAVAGLVGVLNSRRAGVSGDEREARRDESAQRRDLLADRDALIADLQEERAEWKMRALAAEVSLAIETEWARALVDQIYRLHGQPIPRPPDR